MYRIIFPFVPSLRSFFFCSFSFLSPGHGEAKGESGRDRESEIGGESEIEREMLSEREREMSRSDRRWASVEGAPHSTRTAGPSLPRRKSVMATKNHTSSHRLTTHNRTSPLAHSALAHRRSDPLSVRLSLSRHLSFSLRQYLSLFYSLPRSHSPDLPPLNPFSASSAFSAPTGTNLAPQALSVGRGFRREKWRVPGQCHGGAVMLLFRLGDFFLRLDCDILRWKGILEGKNGE